MPTREAALKAAARVVADGYRVLFFAPLEEAVSRALRPGGPSADELRERIAAWRRDHINELP